MFFEPSGGNLSCRENTSSRFFFVAALCFWSTSAVAVSALPEFVELADKAGPAVVNISTMKVVNPSAPNNLRNFFNFKQKNMPNGGPLDDFFNQFEQFFNQPQGQRKHRSLGSGFIISSDGFIVTNNHVIADADKVTVNLQGHGKNGEGFDAEVIGRDPETDLALLKIDVGKPLPVLAFGDSGPIKVGQWVMAIGNPFGLEHTVTAGIISAKGRIIGSGPFDDFIQTDASINPGNSGGPLLNLQGEVIGINTAIVASGQGIGFAIPSNMAKRIIAQLKEHKTVQRGWLGVTIQDVDENTAKALELDPPRGALVASVLPGQPAEKAGLRTGDVIIEVNGAEVKTSNDLLRTIAALPPGEKVKVRVWRKGKGVSMTVRLGERDVTRLAQQQVPEEHEASGLGLSMRPVENEKEAKALGLDSPHGLLITVVADDSPAVRGDVRPGDVVLEVNQHPVNTVKEFLEVLERDGKEKGVVMLLIKRRGQNVFRTIPLE